MTEEKLKEFNIELQALLLKYNCNLQVNHGFQVVPRETTTEVTGTEEVKAESETTATEDTK